MFIGSVAFKSLKFVNPLKILICIVNSGISSFHYKSYCIATLETVTIVMFIYLNFFINFELQCGEFYPDGLLKKRAIRKLFISS